MRMPKIIIQVCQYNYNVLLFFGPPNSSIWGWHCWDLYFVSWDRDLPLIKMLLKHVGKAHILDYKLNHVDVHQQKLCAKPTKMRGYGSNQKPRFAFGENRRNFCQEMTGCTAMQGTPYQDSFPNFVTHWFIDASNCIRVSWFQGFNKDMFDKFRSSFHDVSIPGVCCKSTIYYIVWQFVDLYRRQINDANTCVHAWVFHIVSWDVVYLRQSRSAIQATMGFSATCA